ncbi:MAG TPA: ribosomal protein S18-alanine N-acetyltransferase [Azospira sp.]|nr:ribosomal protein S18-alanine N-acetyltransferase [Azospira sp.]
MNTPTVPAAELAPLEFLPMNLKELDQVLAIEERVYSHPWTRGNFADSMKAGYSCWVAREGGSLVGYLVLMPSLDETHLLNISVAAEKQGRGYGARLLRFAMEVSRHGGAGTMLLEVRPSNAKALALYENYGFQVIGRRKGYYPAAPGREDALVLRRTLGEIEA